MIGRFLSKCGLPYEHCESWHWHIFPCLPYSAHNAMTVLSSFASLSQQRTRYNGYTLILFEYRYGRVRSSRVYFRAASAVIDSSSHTEPRMFQYAKPSHFQRQSPLPLDKRTSRPSPLSRQPHLVNNDRSHIPPNLRTRLAWNLPSIPKAPSSNSPRIHKRSHFVSE